LVLVGAGCGLDRQDPTNRPQDQQPGAASVQNVASGRSEYALDEQVGSAVQSLAERIGSDPEAIDVVEARAVTWRSGALGCPRPGLMYTQALTPGTLILLRAGNDLHSYHARRGGEVFYCPPELAEQPMPQGGLE